MSGNAAEPKARDEAPTLTPRSSDESEQLPKVFTEPPSLDFNPWDHKLAILLSLSTLVFFDIVLPCVLYYILDEHTNLDEQTLLGLACLSLGLGELLELPIRIWRLVRRPDTYKPLGQSSKWALDATSWIYLAATIVAIIPYILATDMDFTVEWLFLYAPGILVAFFVPFLVITMIRFRLPFRMSSDAAGTTCKPIVYYFVEDFLAVDCGEGRAFRERWRARYDASPIMRKLIWEMNIWWTIGCICILGLLAGVTWGLSFDIAYGLSFGVFFGWIGLWSLVTWLWTRRSLRQERTWFQERIKA